LGRFQLVFMTKEIAMTTEFILARTGDIPLKLTGTKLVSMSTQFSNGKDRNRWHVVTVYESTRMVAHIEWCSTWEGESQHSTCLIADDLESLADHIREYDPLKHLMGFPDGQQFEKKQARLENAIASDWDSMLSDLFMKLEVAETL
jgi:hypothetical protein